MSVLGAVDHSLVLRIEYERALHDAEIDFAGGRLDCRLEPRLSLQEGQKGQEGQEGQEEHPLSLVTELLAAPLVQRYPISSPSMRSVGPSMHFSPSRPRSDSDVAADCRGAFAAVAELHRHSRVLHLDVKRGNLVRGPRGACTLVDFDLAAVLEPGQSAVRGGRGTPTSVPPETWLGRGMSRASDVWALGIMLYCAAHPGRTHPFEAAGPAAFAAIRGRDLGAFRGAMLSCDYDDAMWGNGGAPLARELCEMLLAADPEDRPDAAEAACAYSLPLNGAR
jgi:serine/threonine protein kinase